MNPSCLSHSLHDSAQQKNSRHDFSLKYAWLDFSSLHRSKKAERSEGWHLSTSWVSINGPPKKTRNMVLIWFGYGVMVAMVKMWGWLCREVLVFFGHCMTKVPEVAECLILIGRLREFQRMPQIRSTGKHAPSAETYYASVGGEN